MTKTPARIYLERGRTWVFACSLDWPGWVRRGKGDESAIEELLSYGPRYQQAIEGGFVPPTSVEVVGAATGNSTTDFGAPDARGRWDDEPLSDAELARHVSILRASWAYFDHAGAASPGNLRKGPRGGGRELQGIVSHVTEAERAFSAKAGTRIPKHTPCDAQRDLIADGLLSRPGETKWPLRYAIRRMAWHVLDHAWEIEDRSAGE